MKFARPLILATIASCGFFFSSAQAHAATIYANSATGNDTTGSGTSGAPYQTFHKAYTSASSGDTIDLTGTFTWTDAAESGDATTTGYAIAKNLTIRGQGMDVTIVQANALPATADRSVFSISSGSTVTLQDLQIRNGVGSGGQRGGGVSNYGTLTLVRTRVTGNTYNSTSYYGAGGVYSDTNTTITVASSTVEGNSFIGRYYGSGGMYTLQNVSSTVAASTFSYNTSTSDSPNTFAYSYAAPSGGFGAFRFGTGRITNSTFFSNWTNSYGGAMQIYYKDSFFITNCTIVNNSSTYGAGGILYQSEWDGYNLYLKNTILANNTGAGSSNDFYAYDSSSANRITDNGYNIVEYSTNKTWSGTGNITGDQASLNLASSLAANNSTQGPMTLALSSGSVAINAGSSAAANGGVAVPVLDERGAARASTVDIGAFEYGGVIPGTTYTFTYTAGANGSLSGSSTQLVVAGASGSAITAVADTGYHFVAWSDSSSTNPRTDTNASANVTVSASFAIDSYTLSYSAGSHGTLSGSSTQLVTYGSSGSAVTAVADGGYAFIGWSDGSSTNPRTDTNVTGTASFTASFADLTAPVISSVSASPGDTDATVTWTTDEAASSKVIYGTDTSYADTTAEADTSGGVTSHSVAISSLTTCTTYHYKVVSRDASLNAATSTDGTFETSGCPVPEVSSGKGGIGGGSSIVPVTPVFQVAQNGVIISTGSPPPAPAGRVLAAEESMVPETPACIANPFTRSFAIGTRGEDVRRLQSFLNANGFPVAASGPGSKGNETTYFGPATSKAWNAFGVRACRVAFSRDLKTGMSGDDIRRLQSFLNANGFPVAASGPGSKGNETTYFGPATKNALKSYQKTNQLPEDGLLAGKTRQSVNDAP